MTAPGRIGIDMVPFTRVRALLGGGLLAGRMLSADERRLLLDGDEPDVPGIAGRLAAKEAVFKLFHATGETVPWQGIEILRAESGAPWVRLSGRAAALARGAGIGSVSVSITHDEPCAVAVALTAPDSEERSAP